MYWSIYPLNKMRPVQNKKKRLDLDNIQYIEINLFDHDIKGQVHIVDIPLFDTLAILDLQTKKLPIESTFYLGP
jgi:hypothetical protein